MYDGEVPKPIAKVEDSIEVSLANADENAMEKAETEETNQTLNKNESPQKSKSSEKSVSHL